MFTSQFQEWVRAAARRLVRLLGLERLSPNTLTVIGLFVNLLSGILIGAGFLVLGGLVLLLASVFDILDGAVARVTGKVYRYGAFLDSTTDRYAEGFTYIGLLYYYLFNGHHTVEPMLVIASLTGSLLVSYVRARAQSLGFVCDGGILARPERVVIICLGLLVSQLLLPLLWVLAVLTNVTAVQRIWFVWRQSRQTATAD
ncbi:MAG TPA: CDP-alcohol phosphatidyltransferase family protein [Candidatus Dormibacteraeota bacterium]|nr:CDP-alcohol phosphatidyltransferase family protein [Candidatus Dormibacteraeota bacterium]